MSRVRVPLTRAGLKVAGEDRLARALDARECPAAPVIEAHRAELLRNQSPLVDGTLTPGPYDDGQSVSDVAKVSRTARSARLLYSIAKEFAPKTILELGTNVGISSAYLAASGGHVTTFEVSPYRVRLAQRLHRKLGISVDYVCGLFVETLSEALTNLPPVELAFIDGHHQYQPTLDYYELIRRHAAPRCVYLFDDIRWSEGMFKAWSEIKSATKLTADLGTMGVAIPS